MKIITTFFLLLLIASCTTSSDPFFCKCDTSHVSKNDSIISAYFPDENSYNRYLKIWKLDHLSSYKKETYRLLITHSFNNYIQIYTLTKQQKGAKLLVTQYGNSRSNKKDDKYYELFLTEENWGEIKKSIESKCYWTNLVGKNKHSGLDGGHWVLEGYDPLKQNCANNLYHFDACGYDYPGDLADICRMIKKFAKEERLNIH